MAEPFREFKGSNIIVDEIGQPPVDPETPLYESRGGQPILAPDGHHVTLGEFDMVMGRADVRCVRSGTHVVIHLMGLIPNGVYTLWIRVYDEGGNFYGGGAAGKPFTASASGNGTLSAIIPAGDLSVMGAVGSCLLTEYRRYISMALIILMA
jgi:hypothetical protein